MAKQEGKGHKTTNKANMSKNFNWEAILTQKKSSFELLTEEILIEKYYILYAKIIICVYHNLFVKSHT